MFSSFFASKKWALWAYGGVLVLILSLVYQTNINVAINAWYKEFYDLAQNAIDSDSKRMQKGVEECLKHSSDDAKCRVKQAELELYTKYEKCISDNNLNKDEGQTGVCAPSYQAIVDFKVDGFWRQIWRFLYLAMPYVIVYTITQFFASHWMFRWRDAMTFAYMESWRKCVCDIECSSQRIQEDIYRFSKLMENIGLKIIRALMILIAFLPVLWGLSEKVHLPLLKDIPGSLVWVALVVSIGGLIISWFVGILLPKYEYEVQKTEAAFRKELVYAEDDKVKYASQSITRELFEKMRSKYYNLFLHTGYFDVWLISFSQFMVIVPYIVMGVGLFTGGITLGVLIQSSNAFQQVRASFNVFTNNWTTITELRSIYRRLKEFEQSIGWAEKKAKLNKVF